MGKIISCVAEEALTFFLLAFPVVDSSAFFPNRLLPKDKTAKLLRRARDGDIDPLVSLLCSQLSDFNAFKLARASGSTFSLLLDRSNDRTVTN